MTSHDRLLQHRKKEKAHPGCRLHFLFSLWRTLCIKFKVPLTLPGKVLLPSGIITDPSSIHLDTLLKDQEIEP